MKYYLIIILTFPKISCFILLLKASAKGKICTLCMTTPPAHSPSSQNIGCNATINSNNFPYLVMREIICNVESSFLVSYLPSALWLNSSLKLSAFCHLTWLRSPSQYFQRSLDRSSVSGRLRFCLVHKSNATRMVNHIYIKCDKASVFAKEAVLALTSVDSNLFKSQVIPRFLVYDFHCSFVIFCQNL